MEDKGKINREFFLPWKKLINYKKQLSSMGENTFLNN